MFRYILQTIILTLAIYFLFQRDPTVEGIECEVEVDIDDLLDMDDDHQRTQFLQVILH